MTHSNRSKGSAITVPKAVRETKCAPFRFNLARAVKYDTMENELEELYKELNGVRSCDLAYLPKYGYSSKDEIIQRIEEDIEELRAQLKCNQYDYTPGELEDERTNLCLTQGLPIYC